MNTGEKHENEREREYDPNEGWSECPACRARVKHIHCRPLLVCDTMKEGVIDPRKGANRDRPNIGCS